LAFDSKLTIVANLWELNTRKLRFLTLRSRKPSVVQELPSLPGASWIECELDVPHRKYRHPKVIDNEFV
jgi:hypothetical protein